MSLKLAVGLLGIALLADSLSAQTSPSRTLPKSANAATRSGSLQSLITGSVIDREALPIREATVRLRNLDTKSLDEATKLNPTGEFRFVAQPGVSYVVELVDSGGRIVAVGDVVTVNAGEIVGTQLSIALTGVVGSTTSSPLPAALSGWGMTVRDESTLPPISPEK